MLCEKALCRNFNPTWQPNGPVPLDEFTAVIFPKIFNIKCEYLRRPSSESKFRLDPYIQLLHQHCVWPGGSAFLIEDFFFFTGTYWKTKLSWQASILFYEISNSSSNYYSLFLVHFQSISWEENKMVRDLRVNFYSASLKMEAASSCGTSINNYQITRCLIPTDFKL